MSINQQGSVPYKTDELMKYTKAKLIERMLALNKLVDELEDAFKFDPSTPRYQWDFIGRMRRTIHE